MVRNPKDGQTEITKQFRLLPLVLWYFFHVNSETQLPWNDFIFIFHFTYVLSLPVNIWSLCIFHHLFSGQSSFSQPSFIGIFTHHSFWIWKHSQRLCVQAAFQIPCVLLQGWKWIHIWKVSQSFVRQNFVKFQFVFFQTRLLSAKFTKLI